ncbi:MAG TPA: TIGR03435 family protein [Candidatus Sulfopaludibacter sp.]|jgi:uncharacterized protein (TIGR03435 family)|nr:TIGR03435 family protein [Candidatus Sulfopaludibacter sp.]
MRALLLALAALGAHAQTAPDFEVASVKVAPPRSGAAGYTAVESDPAMVRYSNITLKNLLAMAYRINSDLVSGPEWIDSAQYDVAARLPPDTAKDRVPAMLQRLLTERFKLAVHRETKEQRAYLLVVAKGGPKLKEGRAEGGQSQMWPGGISGPSMPVGVLASMVGRFLGYQVVDKTGLTGTYDIMLRFTPENSKEPGTDLRAALQEQLGLRLETGKAPVETLVVDRAERVPTEN